ncbi:tRNA pseudouridine38/39 synthase [Nematocida sp. LUAm3]|nr:tRNA pseudouridine38/39 synthase [Nematocida sp. LUAm3]KAI5174841.1 tRNA pseudouridine38/39 synthase [Nematocida sp. LUAm2]KAI5177561.1 tRNA pseudouridine38/39 synthase [Nematocida sp. LUAm1]
MPRISKNVLLKLSYNGAAYHGFAYQPGKETVEWHIFLAIHKAKLLFSQRIPKQEKYSLSREFLDAINQIKYQKCGRTDAGVSAASQYISMFLPFSRKNEDSIPYPYDLIINQFLPENIRILGYLPVSDAFSARFSCVWREYEYYFVKGSLDISSMEAHSKKLLGTHWLGRLSKSETPQSKKKRLEKTPKDRVLVEEAVRTIDSISFEKLTNYKGISPDIYCMRIKAKSFLHNQVRKTFALLHMIGSGSPIQIENVLNKEVPLKIDIPLASPTPLVLSNCGFSEVDLKEIVTTNNKRTSHQSVLNNVVVSSAVSLRIAEEPFIGR